jgi:hypothetical protein
VAVYTVTSTTDLTSKTKRIASVQVFSTAGGTVQLKDGVGGTIRYSFVLAANGDRSIVFAAPALPVFISGVQVVISGTDATCTVDLL